MIGRKVSILNSKVKTFVFPYISLTRTQGSELVDSKTAKKKRKQKVRLWQDHKGFEYEKRKPRESIGGLYIWPDMSSEGVVFLLVL